MSFFFWIGNQIRSMFADCCVSQRIASRCKLVASGSIHILTIISPSVCISIRWILRRQNEYLTPKRSRVQAKDSSSSSFTYCIAHLQHLNPQLPRITLSDVQTLDAAGESACVLTGVYSQRGANLELISKISVLSEFFSSCKVMAVVVTVQPLLLLSFRLIVYMH